MLERARELRLRDIALPSQLGPRDVRVAMRSVGICGSDLEYYRHGRIGDFVVEEPMVLGHEGSGVVEEVGAEVTSLRVGDRVAMEPGIPDPSSRCSRLGLYNLDPAVRFWATPPVHGCLTPSVVHPADFTFRVPDAVSFDQAALVEPLAVGVHACNKVGVRPGDVAVVTGCGPIGIVTALSAIASGCARVIISDVKREKLDIAERMSSAIVGVHAQEESLRDAVRKHTGGWGADAVFECSGDAAVAASAVDMVRPDGCVMFVGMSNDAVPLDLTAMQLREARLESCFRYRHCYPPALQLLGSGSVDLADMVTHRFPFEQAKEAFEFAAEGRGEACKVVIHF